MWYLADVLNKLECGDVDHSIEFARYRVEWLCSLLVRLGGSLEEILGLTEFNVKSVSPKIKTLHA